MSILRATTRDSLSDFVRLHARMDKSGAVTYIAWEEGNLEGVKIGKTTAKDLDRYCERNLKSGCNSLRTMCLGTHDWHEMEMHERFQCLKIMQPGAAQFFRLGNELMTCIVKECRRNEKQRAHVLELCECIENNRGAPYLFGSPFSWRAKLK